MLGAGASQPAGYPSADSLTERILSCEGVKRNSNGTYQLTEPDESERAVVQLVNGTVRHLHRKAQHYFEQLMISPTHYEHLYYLVKQVRDEEYGEMENPAIGPFAKELAAELTPMLRSASGKDVPMTLRALYREVCHYIADVVWHSLLQKPDETNQLKPLAEACRSGRVISISTLCHDTHVETYLNHEGVKLADGFLSSSNGYRYWKDSFPSEQVIPFLKLHGSVDWFLLDAHSGQICIPPKGQYQQRLQSEDGALCYAVNSRPEMLIGTFNKIAGYSQGIFHNPQNQFRRTLNEVDQLVICGYNFGDQGINTVILEWLYAKLDHRRLKLIHPDPEELIRNARGTIRNRWERGQLDPEGNSLKKATTVKHK